MVVTADIMRRNLRGITEGSDGRKMGLTKIGSKCTYCFEMAHGDTIKLDHRLHCLVSENALITLRVSKGPA